MQRWETIGFSTFARGEIARRRGMQYALLLLIARRENPESIDCNKNGRSNL